MSLSYHFTLFFFFFLSKSSLLLYYNIIIHICVNRGKKASGVDAKVVAAIKSMLDEHNPIVQSFRSAAERVKGKPDVDVKLCLIGKLSRDGRMYNLRHVLRWRHI